MAAPLQVHEFGPPDGVPLLALHGLTGHGARWQALADEQLPGYRVIAPDLRGHGRSTSLPPWTLEQHAADVLQVIDRYRLAAVPVLAHSFGAAIALQAQRLAPGRVSKLVLLDPATGLPPSIALDHASNPPRVFATQRDAFQAQRYDWPAASDLTIERELAEHLERAGDRWRFRFNAPAAITAWSEMARPAVLPQPGTPTLLVRATRERYVSDALVNGCRMILGKDFELVEMDCGHMIYLERAPETGALITKFVGKG